MAVNECNTFDLYTRRLLTDDSGQAMKCEIVFLPIASPTRAEHPQSSHKTSLLAALINAYTDRRRVPLLLHSVSIIPDL